MARSVLSREFLGSRPIAIGDDPVPVATVAERVGAQADPLARVLRLLESRGVFKRRAAGRGPGVAHVGLAAAVDAASRIVPAVRPQYCDDPELAVA